MKVRVILLPGLDGSGVQFQPLVDRLEESYSISVVPYPANSIRYGDHTASVLRHLPSDSQFVLVAESYSGPVAIQLAARKPPGLVGLVLCASFVQCPSFLLANFKFLLDLVPPWRIPAEWMAPFVLGSWKTPQSMALLSKALSAVPPTVLLKRLKEVSGVDVSVQARSIDIPVLYLRAKSDRLVPTSAGDAVARCVPVCEIRELEGPHFLLQSNAADASEEIMKYVSARVAQQTHAAIRDR